MEFYATKKETTGEKIVVLDDMLLTQELPTTAGSKMLEGYQSLLDAEALGRLKEAGYTLGGKAVVGEFAIDLVGETAYTGALSENGVLVSPVAEILKAGQAMAAVNLDVNGAVRRSAAQNGLVCIKPTYGTISRYGTVPVACSGETVSPMATTVASCSEILHVLIGHDDKDGTSLSEEQCQSVKTNAPSLKKVALLKSMQKGVDAEVSEKLQTFCQVLKNNGVEVCQVEDTAIAASRVAWNILMSAELCNNVSRYDGVKYGYRTENFTNLDELYVNSRTEAFGDLLKTAILFGSETLSTENYMKVYDKALRCRRVIKESFDKIFADYDAVLMPACSAMGYTEVQVKENPYLPFEENFYTAPASITGLPALVAGGVQLVGKAFSENTLFEAAKLYEKEGK